MTAPGLTLQERFEKYVSPEPNTGCWLWDGTLDAYGYGALRVNNKTLKAHRVALKLDEKEVPDYLGVLHKCDVRCCVNPEHLFVGTRAENLADMRSKGRGFRRVPVDITQAIGAAAGTRFEVATRFSVSISYVKYARQQLKGKQRQASA